MRKKLTSYIEEEDIKKLKRLALEQDTSVSDILGALVSEHFKIKIVCICDLEHYIKNKVVQYEDKIFEFDRFEDLEYAVKFYKNNKEVCFIEHEFFEVKNKGKLIELIPCENFIMIDKNFVKEIK